MDALERLKSSPHFRPRTKPVDISEVEAGIGNRLPADLCELLESCEGFEGFFGENYFWFYPVEEFVKINADPNTREIYSGHLIFATSGGGEFYSHNTNLEPPRYFMIPAIGNPEVDGSDQGPTLEHLLDRIEHDRLFDPPPP